MDVLKKSHMLTLNWVFLKHEMTSGSQCWGSVMTVIYKEQL